MEEGGDHPNRDAKFRYIPTCAGGSNDAWLRLWKLELQKLANERKAAPFARWARQGEALRAGLLFSAGLLFPEDGKRYKIIEEGSG